VNTHVFSVLTHDLQVYNQCLTDPTFARDNFGTDKIDTDKDGWKSWEYAMMWVDNEALETAWNLILVAVNGVSGASVEAKIRKIFDSINTDGSPDMDLGELAIGMKAYGADFTPRQLKAFIRSVDTDGACV